MKAYRDLKLLCEAYEGVLKSTSWDKIIVFNVLMEKIPDLILNLQKTSGSKYTESKKTTASSSSSSSSTTPKYDAKTESNEKPQQTVIMNSDEILTLCKEILKTQSLTIDELAMQLETRSAPRNVKSSLLPFILQGKLKLSF